MVGACNIPIFVVEIKNCSPVTNWTPGLQDAWYKNTCIAYRKKGPIIGFFFLAGGMIKGRQLALLKYPSSTCAFMVIIVGHLISF
jgi:hypothetical protein